MTSVRHFILLIVLSQILFLETELLSQQNSPAYIDELSNGMIALTNGDTLRAENHLKASLEAENNSIANFQLAKIYFNKGSFSDLKYALDYIDDAININKNDAEYWYLRGRIHEALFTESILYVFSKGTAIDSYEQAVKVNPKHVKSYVRLGNIYKDEFLEYHISRQKYFAPLNYRDNPFNQSRMAYQSARQTFEYETNSPELAYSTYSKEVFTKSEYNFLKALETAPLDYDANKKLALLYEEADLPEKGISILLNLPNNSTESTSEINEFLGMLYYETHDHENAFNYFEKALQHMNKDDAEDFKYNSVQLLIESALGENFDKISEKEKKNFIEFYWKERDPLFLTGYNERLLEHYYRVAYANLKFGVEAFNIPGWKTNRGEMFIRYGMPLEHGRYRANPAQRETSLVSDAINNDDGTPKLPATEYLPGGGRPVKTEIWDYADFKLAFSDPYRNDNYQFSSVTDMQSSHHYGDTQMLVETKLRKEQPERYFPEFEGPIIDIFYNVTQFKNLQNNRTDYFVNYGLPLKNDQINSPISIGIFLFDQYLNLVDNKKFEWTPGDVSCFSILDSLDCIYVNSTQLKTRTNSFNVAVELLRKSDKAVGSIHAKAEVKSFRGDTLMMSNILIAEDILLEEKQNYPLVRNNVSILPNPSSIVKRENPFFIYYEIYNLKKGINRLNDFDQSISIIRKEGEFEKTVSDALKIFGLQNGDNEIELETNYKTNENIPQIFLQLDMEDYAVGEYNLEVKIKDNVSGNVAVNTSRLILVEN